MRHEPVSPRRRQVMVASLVGIAAPATVLAAPLTPREALRAEQLVISGRILGADGRPLAGATVEAWHPEAHGDRATVTTDGDGRFFASLAPARHSGRMRHLNYRVKRDSREMLSAQRLYFTRAPGAPHDGLAHVERDETGVWRASFGITLA